MVTRDMETNDMEEEPEINPAATDGGFLTKTLNMYVLGKDS